MFQLPTVKDNLARYIDAGFPILYIHTFEEAKADELIKSAAGTSEVLEWNGANGFVDFLTKTPFMQNQQLESTLNFLKSDKELHRKLLVIKDAHDLIDTKEIIALLKEIARKIRRADVGIDSTIIIVSSSIRIPQALEKMTTVLELDYPDEYEISGIIKKYLEHNEIPAISGQLLNEMSRAFKGLTEFEIEDLVRLAISEDGDLTNKALSLIFDQKQQMILKAGILEMIPLKESIADIGGLENLVQWLKNKAEIIKNIKSALDFGVTMPKGVLIAGIPGCGKSLCAKAAGHLFNVPLLRLDMGRIMGRYVGESEENMRRAIRLAEAISPCVLWVDELEKALAGTKGGQEVTTRLLGSFLTWMQEKTSATFIVATANDITGLPPELMRKGRFDDIFYVPLPNPYERKKIFEIHIGKRRKQDLASIDVAALVKKTEGYSGADIEGVVAESIENAFIAQKVALTTEDILNCISNTQSLSVIMDKELGKMVAEYEKRKLNCASR